MIPAPWADRDVGITDPSNTPTAAKLNDAVRTGAVSRNSGSGERKQHLCLSMQQLQTWASTRQEVAMDTQHDRHHLTSTRLVAVALAALSAGIVPGAAAETSAPPLSRVTTTISC